MAKPFVLVVVCTFVVLNVFSQGVENDSVPPVVYSDGALEKVLTGGDLSGLNMIHDARLDSLMILQKEVNERANGIKGYRVQMFRGNLQGDSKIRAREVQGMVLSKFPQMEVDVFYQAPFWRVQIGRYRMRNEAMKAQRILQQEFRDLESDISIVPTTIGFPKLEKEPAIDRQKSVQDLTIQN